MFTLSETSGTATYESGFGLNELMPVNVTGIVTARDALVTDFDRSSLVNKLERFRDLDRSDAQTRAEFFGSKKVGDYEPGDTRGWKLPAARRAIANLSLSNDIKPLLYRPFDIRPIFYRPDMVDWGREKYMRHLADRPNLGLIYSRQAVAGEAGYNHVLVTPFMFDNRGFYTNKGISQVAPLYLANGVGLKLQRNAINFDPTIYAAICKAANLTPSPDAGEGDAFRTATGDARPSEVKVFDYIYGVLHAPAYRATYAEFLRIDFPRIPYPRDPETFASVSAAGEALRRLHLMEPAAIGDTPYPFTGDGDDTVASGYPKFEDGAVWINADQRFAGVPAIAWDFPIGGYRPAQKWLKDRRGRVLSWDDIGHYQRIVKILTETDRLMAAIDLPIDGDA